MHCFIINVESRKYKKGFILIEVLLILALIVTPLVLNFVKKAKDSATDDGWYHYGKSSTTVYQSYKIGDQVTYNGNEFYVIADSDSTNNKVTMLKTEPLTVDEANNYGIGHANMYVTSDLSAGY